MCGRDYQELHSMFSLAGEAMETLSVLSSADSTWNVANKLRASALLELEEEGDESALLKTVDETMKEMKGKTQRRKRGKMKTSELFYLF